MPEEKYSKRNYREKRPIYKFPSGATYEGEWIGSFKDGIGTMIWSDGARYEGDWKDNKKHGKGKFYFTDGDYFEGEFIQDCISG
mmetsp:Transcript_40409/g.35867  ORF Transcript_40409/g.35867 Transcript_40409/m.35867 type:complete len:84 (-) Transcript_40409:867-1118(-)